MKSRSSSPQTSQPVVRKIRGGSIPTCAYRLPYRLPDVVALFMRWTKPPFWLTASQLYWDTSLTDKVHTAPTHSLRKTSLRIEDLSTSMNGSQPANPPTSAPAPSTAPGLLSPTQNNVRKLSAEYAPSPVRSDSGSSPAQGENSWSSAVGHATTSGKSGRVIERLMTENDKLKRDLNAQMIKCQDLEKSMQTYKPQIEALRQENDNLSHARGVDSGLISRRDRKIEEMKADLAMERQWRGKAEAMARQREREKDEIEEQSRREMQNMTDSTKHATVHADILETSHKQLSAEYRARAEAWRKDMGALTAGREQDRQKLARLDVVVDQMRQELERSKKLNAELAETWEQYREGNDEQLQGLVDEGQQENERTRKLSMEMDQVVNQMRWVMNVKENVRGA